MRLEIVPYCNKTEGVCMRRHVCTRSCITIMMLMLLVGPTIWASGSQEQATTEKPVALRFSWWGGDARHNATLQVIELYEQRNPNVKIEAEYGGWDGYYQKLVTQLAGGTAADIMQIDQPWLFELSSRDDIFLTLDNQSGLDLSGFDPTFLKNYTTHNNQIKGLPTGLNGESLLVDRQMLAACGIDPDTEWTWENIVTEGEKLHRLDDSKYLLATTADQIRFFFEKYMAQIAGAVVDSNKNIAYTQQEAEAAFAYFTQWFDNKVCVPFAESSLYNKKFQENPAWINGDIAIALSWASNIDQSLAGRTNITVASIPLMDNAVDSGIIVRPSQILTINNNSKHKEEAVRFMDFFFNDPEAALILGTVRGVPPTTGSRSILKEHNKLDPLVEKATDIALEKVAAPQSVWQMNSEVAQIMDDIIEEFGYGLLTPAQAASELTRRLTDKLATL